MALIEREKVWELVGEMAETVRHGSKLEGVMRRYANAIDNAPAVDAIPVEWLEDKELDYRTIGDKMFSDAFAVVIGEWQKEQEAR